MSGLELTGGQKLQVAFLVVVFGAAGFLFLRNTRAPADLTISAWTQAHYIGLDPKVPVSARNPIDPAKTTKISTFACHDGKLEIEEFPEGSGLKAEFRFIKDNHRTSYDFYKDPREWTAKLNPFDRAVASAAFDADTRPYQLTALLRSAALDDGQRKAEKEARDAALNTLTLMQEGAKTGNYHPEMYEQVLKALAAFKAKGGDPSKDPAAATLAHNVVNLAMQYLNKIDTDKVALIKKYVDAMDGLLKDDQKTKLTASYKQQQQFANRRWPRGRAG